MACVDVFNKLTWPDTQALSLLSPPGTAFCNEATSRRVRASWRLLPAAPASRFVRVHVGTWRMCKHARAAHPLRDGNEASIPTLALRHGGTRKGDFLGVVWGVEGCCECGGQRQPLSSVFNGFSYPATVWTSFGWLGQDGCEDCCSLNCHTTHVNVFRSRELLSIFHFGMPQHPGSRGFSPGSLGLLSKAIIPPQLRNHLNVWWCFLNKPTKHDTPMTKMTNEYNKKIINK